MSEFKNTPKKYKKSSDNPSEKNPVEQPNQKTSNINASSNQGKPKRKSRFWLGCFIGGCLSPLILGLIIFALAFFVGPYLAKKINPAIISDFLPAETTQEIEEMENIKEIQENIPLPQQESSPESSPQLPR